RKAGFSSAPRRYRAQNCIAFAHIEIEGPRDNDPIDPGEAPAPVKKSSRAACVENVAHGSVTTHPITVPMGGPPCEGGSNGSFLEAMAAGRIDHHVRRALYCYWRFCEYSPCAQPRGNSRCGRSVGGVFFYRSSAIGAAARVDRKRRFQMAGAGE